MRTYDPLEYDDIRSYCDIYQDCRDCPRLGDDCDGRYNWDGSEEDDDDE